MNDELEENNFEASVGSSSSGLESLGWIAVLIGILVLAPALMMTSHHPSTSTTTTTLQGGSSDYRAMARQDAINAGINPDYFVNQINQESGFNPDAISPVGAIGIAQIMPATASEWNVDPHDPVASLRVASQRMSWYQNYFSGDYAKALAAYNCGIGCLDSASKRCLYYFYCLPQETRAYIQAIMR